MKSFVNILSALSKLILKSPISKILGNIALRVVKTVKSSEIKTFDGLGGLYRTAMVVGVAPQSLAVSSS